METKNFKCFIKIVSIAPIVSCKYTKTILPGAENKIVSFKRAKLVKNTAKEYKNKRQFGLNFGKKGYVNNE